MIKGGALLAAGTIVVVIYGGLPLTMALRQLAIGCGAGTATDAGALPVGTTVA
ncbi:hypothetical protein [Kocuria rosea]|uniref:hypothetical protein n=1 Tax=Kocuria rosea TaxID=1275 RepID=UPI0030190055